MRHLLSRHLKAKLSAQKILHPIYVKVDQREDKQWVVIRILFPGANHIYLERKCFFIREMTMLQTMKKFRLFPITICFLLLFASCKKELSCENCRQTIQPLQVPPGDSVLYYQFIIENKNYQAIAYQNNFIVVSTLDWSGTADRDSGVVMGSGLVPPNTSTFRLAPFTFILERGIVFICHC